MTDRDGLEVWQNWLAFLEAARGHGGIVVT